MFETIWPMSEPAGEHDRPEEGEGESRRDSSEQGHSRHGQGERRRRRRRRKPKPTSKAAVAAFLGLIVIVGGGLFYALGPRLARHLKAAVQQQEKIGEGYQYVKLTRQTVLIMNRGEKDWGYTTVTVNDKYEAHAPEIPKGTQFEIWFKSFRGPNGDTIDPKAELVTSVKVQPQGQEAIVWTRPIE
jgi:hypothetical protein